MLHFQPARGLHHVERADNIGIEIGARIFQAVTHARLCREVDDHIGRKVVRHTIE